MNQTFEIKKFSSFCLSIFLFVLPFSSHAQSSWKELTSAEFVLETTAVPQNDPFEIGFLVKLKKGWHTYWKNSGDSGAGPRFDWKDQKDLVQGPFFPVPKTFEDSGIVTFGFEDEVLFVFKHAGLKETTTFNAHAEWLVCKDVCLPADQVFTFTVEVKDVAQIEASSHRKAFEQTRRQWALPEQMEIHVQDGQAHYSVSAKEAPTGFEFFPYKTVPFEKLKVSSQEFKDGKFHWVMGLKPSTKDLVDLGGAARLRFKDSSRLIESHEDLQQGAPKAVTASVLWYFVLAFLGGLILNLMPCVFPILSLKLFSVLKNSDLDENRMRKDHLAYVGGVLVTFMGVGVALSLIRAAGVQVGWGFQLQSPLFVGSLIVLFVILALEMFGFFNFDLVDPSKGQALTRKHGLMGSFFTGVLAVVVASPCSAPFMGAAVGAALAQPGWVGMLVFLFLGIGLAFPYLLLAISPKLLAWVPRPGVWMNVVKEFMAFPLLLTAIWLLWIFTHVSQSQDILVLGFTVISMVFAIWISGYSRKAAWAVAFSIGTAFVAHFVFQEEAPVAHEESSASGWQPYSESLITERGNKVLFVNMTADWCITCKVNERLIFETTAVQQAFSDLGVTKIKGDWTRRDPKITAFLDRFQRAGVPFYVIYSDKNPTGEVLSEVLTPEGFIETLKKHTGEAR